MYYTIYKISNKINGKIYIGSHKTKNLDDGYMGSGKYLKHAQEKHGMENFEKEILFIFDTPELMYEKEAELVNEEFIAEENTYNIKVGGFGGWDYLNSTGLNNSSKTKEQLQKGGYIGRGREPCVNSINATKLAHIEGKYTYANFLGKKHTDKTKHLISIKLSEVSRGSNNSQYGTMWIHNPLDFSNKKIDKTDQIPEGWIKGRKFK
jgi:hypothetical protein